MSRGPARPESKFLKEFRPWELIQVFGRGWGRRPAECSGFAVQSISESVGSFYWYLRTHWAMNLVRWQGKSPSSPGFASGYVVPEPE
jgi:hypothetical protein